MNFFKNSVYLNHANKSLAWLPMDTKDLYEKNLINKYELLKKYDWIDTNITYNFNNQGFRCADFEDGPSGPSVIFLGCSFTLGIGLPKKDIFPTLVSNELNLTCYNLAQAGSSSDTAFRLGYYWIPQLKPKLVVMLAPEIHRLEHLYMTEKNEIESVKFLPQLQNLEEWYKKYILIKENSDLNRIKNHLAIENICQTNNVKLLYLTYEDHFLKFRKEFGPEHMARDLAHPGKITHKKFAEEILSMID
jgi:hypothetical protein